MVILGWTFPSAFYSYDKAYVSYQTAILKAVIPICILGIQTVYFCFLQQIKQREHTEKVNLLLSCGQYKLWPHQPLLQVAELIEWISYPPNTGNSDIYIILYAQDLNVVFVLVIFITLFKANEHVS